MIERMFRSTGSPACASVLLLSALAAAGCGDSPSSPTTSEPQAPAEISETFSDMLNPNGARTHPFVVSRAGTVLATLTAVSPDAEIVVGLSLGTLGATGACQLVITNDNARQGVTLTGNAGAIGNFCVRVYDVGRLTENIEYSLTIVHF